MGGCYWQLFSLKVPWHRLPSTWSKTRLVSNQTTCRGSPTNWLICTTIGKVPSECPPLASMRTNSRIWRGLRPTRSLTAISRTSSGTYKQVWLSGQKSSSRGFLRAFVYQSNELSTDTHSLNVLLKSCPHPSCVVWFPQWPLLGYRPIHSSLDSNDRTGVESCIFVLWTLLFRRVVKKQKCYIEVFISGVSLQ